MNSVDKSIPKVTPDCGMLPKSPGAREGRIHWPTTTHRPTHHKTNPLKQTQ